MAHPGPKSSKPHLGPVLSVNLSFLVLSGENFRHSCWGPLPLRILDSQLLLALASKNVGFLVFYGHRTTKLAHMYKGAHMSAL